MVYLLASIVLTSYLTLAFKFLGRQNINSFQAIVFNYLTCVITGSVVLGYFPLNTALIEKPWFPWAILMGTMFITIFNLIAYSAQYIGVAVTSVANKLSLVIPFAFSIYFYGESSTALRYGGIVLAIIAVILTCYPQKKNDPLITGKTISGKWMVPLLLFLSSGMLDTLIKFVEQTYLSPADQDAYLITTFATAAAIGLSVTIVRVLSRKIRLSKRAMIAGFAIGIPNYFSIASLLHVLKQFPTESSMVIPVNNMGIVLFSAVAAFLLFRERLSSVNWLGILLSVLAISLIAFG